MARVLVIDDEPNMRWVLQEALGKAGYYTHGAGSGEEALALLAETSVDIAILDLKMKGMDGLATLRHIHTRWPDVVVLILTAFGTVATAVEALQAGAADYLRKPFDIEDVLFKVSRALERQHLYAEISRLKGGEPPPTPGTDPAWRAAIVASAEALTQGLDVRLSGEAGSGRAGVGGAAHLASPRRAAPLVVCDLAVLPPLNQGALLEGDERADSFWNAAGSGSLLLRHIGKLSRSGAEALSRLIKRRGTSGTGPLLLLTGTAEEWAGAPALPHHYVEVSVPPLREHIDDLSPFAATWLPQRSISPNAAELLHAYGWPGNLSELRAVLERADKLAGAGPIEVLHLPERVRAAPLPNTPFRLPPEGLSLEELEIGMIRQALARAGGNKTRAAELLGLTRHTLLYRLEKYKIADAEP
jgi:two-component system response regulator AtoC